ncbi:YidB family protein [Streptomyces gobiensis]|uniref:YidB family protein n=1 Tax=Streptomyces gobiensis TaxID=2875706 RepID=UPI001E457F89|nr:YidB family protein [Streptomyces gobiensis]UGY90604.1 YidB family protein [Streptomyces gobiensis]
MAGDDPGLERLLGGLLGKQSGTGGADTDMAGNVLAALLGLLESQGGGGSVNPLEGLLKCLSAGGLGDQARSWVSGDENEPVSAEQVTKALPEGALEQVAQQAGVSPEEAADQLAQSLPTAVDALTPGGRVPSGGSLREVVEQRTRARG